MERKHIHVSLDIVERFVPRIPEHRIPGEDGTIPRICVSNRLLDCVNAMPSGPETLQIMELLGEPMVIHAYYMQAEQVLPTKEITQYVPDAEWSHESWLLTEPTKVYRVDYHVVNPQFFKPKIGPLKLLAADFKRCPFTDNTKALANRLGVQENSEFVKLIRKYGLSCVLCNIWEEFQKILQMREKEKKDERNERTDEIYS